jgi:MSHA pilin protein MshC
VTRARGFTMVELIAVMILIGVLAAFALPRLVDRNGSATLVFGDQVASSLRLAQKSATARRRVVCAQVAADAVVLRLAAAPGSAACGAVLAGVADDDYRSSSTGVTVGPVGTLYFQPDGTVTSDAAAATFAQVDLAVRADGQLVRTIRVVGSTGYVE